MDKDVLASLMKRFPPKVLANGNTKVLARLVFTKHLVQPQPGKGKGKPKHTCGLLFPEGYDLTVLNKVLVETAIAEHGANAVDLIRAKKVSWPIKDQSEVTNLEGEMYEGFVAGAKFCNIATTIEPGFVDSKAQKCDGSKFQSGCWALVTVHGYAGTFEDDETGMKKRFVSVGLNNMQFLADDERFAGSGGASNPDEEFEPIDQSVAPGAANGAAKPADPFDFG